MVRPGIDIQVDKRQMKRVSRQLAGAPRALPKILARAVNRTAIGSRAEMVKQIRGDADLKAGRIRKGIKLRRARYSTLTATLSLDPVRIGLVNFAARQTKKGVSYKVRKGEGRNKIEGAWIMTANGVKGVFTRGDDGNVILLRGPSIGHVFTNAGTILRDVQKKSAKRLFKEIDGQTALMLRRLRRKA